MEPKASHFFAMIMSKINAALYTYVDEVAGRLIDVAVPASRQIWIICFCMWAFMVMRGAVQAPLADGLFRFLRIAIIIWLLDMSRYSEFIANFFLTAPDQLAVIIAGPSAGGGSINFLDNLWSKLYAFGWAYWEQGTVLSTSGIGFILIAGLVWIVGIAATGGAFVLLVIATVGIHVWLAIGPLPLVLAMVEALKRFFDAWLGQVISFALITVLSAAVIKLILSICELYLGLIAPGGVLVEPGPNQIFPVLVICAAAIVFFWQIPSFATGLGGGVAISTLGAITAGWRAANGMAGSALGGTTNLMTGKTLSDSRAQRRQQSLNKNWAEKNPGLPMRAFRKLTTGKNAVAKA